MAIVRNPNFAYDPYAGSTLELITRGQIEVRLTEHIGSTLGSGNSIRGTTEVNFGVTQHISPTLLAQTANDIALRRMAVEEMVQRMAKKIAAHIEKELMAQILGATKVQAAISPYTFDIGAPALHAKAIAEIKEQMKVLTEMPPFPTGRPEGLPAAKKEPAKKDPNLPKYYPSGIRVSDDDEDDDATT